MVILLPEKFKKTLQVTGFLNGFTTGVCITICLVSFFNITASPPMKDSITPTADLAAL